MVEEDFDFGFSQPLKPPPLLPSGADILTSAELELGLFSEKAFHAKLSGDNLHPKHTEFPHVSSSLSAVNNKPPLEAPETSHPLPSLENLTITEIINSSDEYPEDNGLMTLKERQLVEKIQQSHLNCDPAFADDFYFRVWCETHGSHHAQPAQPAKTSEYVAPDTKKNTVCAPLDRLVKGVQDVTKAHLKPCLLSYM